jgi:hypothetical protein
MVCFSSDQSLDLKLRTQAAERRESGVVAGHTFADPSAQTRSSGAPDNLGFYKRMNYLNPVEREAVRNPMTHQIDPLAMRILHLNSIFVALTDSLNWLSA